MSVFNVHLSETVRHIFTVFYPFHKINSSRQNNIMALKLDITMLIHIKDDIQFVIEFPCFLGHPVDSPHTAVHKGIESLPKTEIFKT